MDICGEKENSRNGPVITLQAPCLLQLWNPMQRVLFDRNRDANPFFHVMEFVWMMAGRNDVEWLAQFNKNMANYSDDGRTFNAAYGFRWREHFNKDQITTAVEMLRADPESRRVVLAMWDPADDLNKSSKDLPCNTQINLRIVRGALDFTVMNRSNDLIWGSLGANAVHMTLLQELIARAIGVAVGQYRVFTTNLHIYTEMPRFQEVWKPMGPPDDRYTLHHIVPQAVLQPGESIYDFLEDCEDFCNKRMEKGHRFKCHWIKTVALPVYRAWFARTGVDDIVAQDWRVACREWIERRQK